MKKDYTKMNMIDLYKQLDRVKWWNAFWLWVLVFVLVVCIISSMLGSIGKWS